MVGVVNYGMGNTGSIVNMIKKIGADVVIINTAEDFERVDRIILPGVGTFDNGMKHLQDHKLIEPIKSAICKESKFLLGICLGMQLLGNSSEEGKSRGLELIDFENKRFSFYEASNFKIPHMGWNIVDFKKTTHPLLNGIEGQQRYYFVHSYHAVCNNQENELMSCKYGYNFSAAVVSGNVMGTQFHPEKSHKFGMKLLENFVRL